MTFDFESMRRADLIRATGYSGTAIDNWTRAGCPRSSDGTFSLSAVIKWLVDRSKGNAPSPALERLRTAQAERAEIKAATDRGEFIPLIFVQKSLERVVGVFRSRVLFIPRKAVPQLRGVSGDAAREKLLMEMVCEALNELSAMDFTPHLEAAKKEIEAAASAEAAATDTEKECVSKPAPRAGKKRGNGKCERGGK